ncbi:MAG: hypothetical protein GY746_16030 [Gammaproteobacteria bacterium]|nr:hypothetical protein [Gammaproteobacteria bacterium]MCP4832519.1 hypothetical protein [Gammaproteobacteria bacterium]
MKIFNLSVASLAAVFIFTTAVAGPDLVSSDNNGIALVTDEANPNGYGMLDVSADGRYVLLGNFDTSNTFAFGQFPLQPESCRILRKDQATGELLTVFETEPSNFGFCNRAKISADGNIVVTSPAGPVVSCTEGGEVTAVIARNIAAGTDTEVKTFWTPSPADIARICVGNGGYSFPGFPVQSITGDARFAVIVNGGNLSGYALLPNYELIDMAAGTIEPIALDTEEGITPEIYSVAVSENGNKLALNVRLLSPDANPGVPTGGGNQSTGPGAVICGQTGRCEPAPTGTTPGTECPESLGYWCYGYEPPIITRAIYILDRVAGTQSIPEALSDLPEGTILQANAWSADGNHLSWLEGPAFPLGRCYTSFPDAEPDCLLTEGCSADECELRVHHYSFIEGLHSTQQTAYNPDTLSGCRAIPTTENYQPANTLLGCVPRLSRDGNKLLYGRAVTHPFGGDWQPSYDFNDISYTCVSQESLAAGEPEFVGCPAPQGPIIVGPNPTPNDPCITDPDSPLCQYPGGNGGLGNFFTYGNGEVNGALGQYDPNNPVYTDQYNKQVVSYYPGQLATNGPILPGMINQADYDSPVLWYVLNLETDHTALVSITDQGQLFQSNGTLFSDNGNTVVYSSQDPRLQSTDPEALAATEAALDEACFWSPAGASSDLRIATNDNVVFTTTADGINIYRETPAFCPVPDPALAAHIFAGDITAGVNLATISFKDWRRGRGYMQTWLGNFSQDAATMVSVTIEVSGLGEGGSVYVAPEHHCESYAPVTAASTDDSILIRCEFDALDSREIRPLRWQMEADKFTVARVITRIESNEAELRARNNVHATRVWLWKRSLYSWIRGRR